MAVAGGGKQWLGTRPDCYKAEGSPKATEGSDSSQGVGLWV